MTAMTAKHDTSPQRANRGVTSRPTKHETETAI
jgi:hypothetical protein